MEELILLFLIIELNSLILSVFILVAEVYTDICRGKKLYIYTTDEEMVSSWIPIVYASYISVIGTWCLAYILQYIFSV